MKRFVEGEARTHGVLLPEFLDDCVAEDNLVRVIDVFVDGLDFAALGFEGAVPEATGRPAYLPATLLKIYLYGYLNRIQSSRRLERGPTQHRDDVADRPTDAGLQDDRRLPPRQRAGAQRTLRESLSCRAVSSTFSPGLSLRSTGATSRWSTIATRTSQWPRSPSALNR